MTWEILSFLWEKEDISHLIRKALRKILLKKSFLSLWWRPSDHPSDCGRDRSSLSPSLSHPDRRPRRPERRLPGRNPFHSTVMRKAADLLGEGRLFQLGFDPEHRKNLKLAKKMKSIVSTDRESLRSNGEALKTDLSMSPSTLMLSIPVFSRAWERRSRGGSLSRE